MCRDCLTPPPPPDAAADFDSDESVVVEEVSPLLVLEALSFSAAVVVEAVAVGGLAADLLGGGARSAGNMRGLAQVANKSK